MDLPYSRPRSLCRHHLRLEFFAESYLSKSVTTIVWVNDTLLLTRLRDIELLNRLLA